MAEDPTIQHKDKVPPDRWGIRWSRTVSFVNKNGLRGLFVLVCRYGVRNSIAFLKRNLRYQLCIILGKRWDRKHPVITCGQIDLEEVDVIGPNKAEGSNVVSTSPKTFALLAQYLPRDYSKSRSSISGRATAGGLLLAQSYGFQRYIGIDLSQ